MDRQSGERGNHADAVGAGLAHADDAAAADMDAGVAHMFERLQAILIHARGDYLAIEFRRSVEIVVVIIESGALESARLRGGQHPERGAGLEPQSLDRLDHLTHALKIAVLWRTPGRTHAEAARAGGLGGARLREHGVERHKLLGRHAGVVMRALRAIGAIFRATAGFDRQQRRNLHLGWIEILPMDALRAKEQVGERQVEQHADLGPRPIVADAAKAGQGCGIVSSKRHEASVASIGLACPALAQDWPSRPVLVISPFTTGSANDIVARLVFDQVGQQIGQAFVVENRSGGGGVVGVASVVHAEPDGYTLLLSSASMSSAVILHRSLPYDELRDLEVIAMLGAQPSVLVAAPGKGFKTVAELVAAAKARPGELNFASAGIGSASHIAYRGPVEALADLITGRIDFYFLPIAPALPLIKQGQVIALAVSTPKRAQLLPEVPTIAEAGYPSAEYVFWGGVSAPAGISPTIVAALNREINTALATPVIQEKLQQLGVEAMPMTPEHFGKFFADDVAAMAQLAKDANIAPMD